MKHSFLLLISVILLASCGQNKKVLKQDVCDEAGELQTSTESVVATTQSGKVAGYIDNGVYIYKSITTTRSCSTWCVPSRCAASDSF